MIRLSLILQVLVVLLTPINSGCSRIARMPANDFAELHYRDNSNDVYIFISENGGARIDLNSASASDRDGSATVFIPSSSKEARRLIAAVFRFDDSRIRNPSRRFFRSEELMTIRCMYHGNTRELALCVHASPNELWNGLINELKIVSNFKLAKSIAEYDTSEARLRAGDVQGATLALQAAADAFSEWEDEFYRRYSDGGVWDPAIDGFNYVLHNQRFTLAGGPNGPVFLQRTTRLDPTAALELALLNWRDYSGLFVTVRSQGCIRTVGFTGEFLSTAPLGVQRSISSSTFNELQRVRGLPSKKGAGSPSALSFRRDGTKVLE